MSNAARALKILTMMQLYTKVVEGLMLPGNGTYNNIVTHINVNDACEFRYSRGDGTLQLVQVHPNRKVTTHLVHKYKTNTYSTRAFLQIYQNACVIDASPTKRKDDDIMIPPSTEPVSALGSEFYEMMKNDDSTLDFQASLMNIKLDDDSSLMFYYICSVIKSQGLYPESNITIYNYLEERDIDDAISSLQTAIKQIRGVLNETGISYQY